MGFLARLSAAIGVAIALLGIVGRFKGPPTVSFYGDQFAASSVLLTANTFLLLAVFAALAHRRN